MDFHMIWGYKGSSINNVMFFGGLTDPPSPMLYVIFQNRHTVIFKAYFVFFYPIFNFFYFTRLGVKVPMDG